MTWMNREGGWLSRPHNMLLRFVVGTMAVTGISLAVSRAAPAQTSDSNSLPNAPSQTKAQTAARKKPVASAKMLERGSIFFPDLAHSANR
jgi:hypothetical protein